MKDWNDVVETIRDFEKSQIAEGKAESIEVMAVLILSDGTYYKADISSSDNKNPWSNYPKCKECRESIDD